MATLYGPVPGASGDGEPVERDEGVIVCRVPADDPDVRRQALGLLLTGDPGCAESAVRHFVDFLREQRMALDNFWVAQRDGALEAAALVVECIGRTAMIFFSPVVAAGDLPMISRLVRTACRAQSPQRATLIQALLDPPQALERQALERAGMTYLAHLSYMQCRTDRRLTPLDLDPPLQVVHYSPQARPLFAQAVLASYEDTLDCPGLLGLREVEDVLDGHMATGRFQAPLWFALRHGEEPAGVMLINLAAAAGAAEMVYLGLARRWRGRGLAKRLLRHGLGAARQHGATSMVLAVDERNEPALRLYRSMRFSFSARKVAMIFTLA